jgi:hypothetical protein
MKAEEYFEGDTNEKSVMSKKLEKEGLEEKKISNNKVKVSNSEEANQNRGDTTRELKSTEEVNQNRGDTTRELRSTEECDADNKIVLQLKENINNVSNNTTIKNNNTLTKGENQVYNNFISEAGGINAHMEKSHVTTVKKANFITYSDLMQLSADDIEFEKRTFMMCLKDSLIQKHPVVSFIFKRSLKDPAFLRFYKLIFKASMFFGFEALIFTEYYIERRLETPFSVSFLLNL